MKNTKFSKRHYVAIAETIRTSENSKYKVAKQLATMFSEDSEENSEFEKSDIDRKLMRCLTIV